MLDLLFFEIPKNWSRKEARKISRILIKKHFGIKNFEKTKEGKPKTNNFYLSFSYTKYLGCVAIADQNIGIDIEYIDDSFSWEDLRWVFEKERKDVISKSHKEQKEMLFRLWTIKEAYTKFLGKGFLIDPRDIEIDCQKFSAKNEKDIKIYSEIFEYKNRKFSLALAIERRMGDGKITPLIRRSLRSLFRKDSDYFPKQKDHLS